MATKEHNGQIPNLLYPLGGCFSASRETVVWLSSPVLELDCLGVNLSTTYCFCILVHVTRLLEDPSLLEGKKGQ